MATNDDVHVGTDYEREERGRLDSTSDPTGKDYADGRVAYHQKRDSENAVRAKEEAEKHQAEFDKLANRK